MISLSASRWMERISEVSIIGASEKINKLQLIAIAIMISAFRISLLIKGGDMKRSSPV